MLSFFVGAEIVRRGEFEAGNETYVLDDVECTGDEQSLGECAHSTVPNCRQVGQEDAGVRCRDGGGRSIIRK